MQNPQTVMWAYEDASQSFTTTLGGKAVVTRKGIDFAHAWEVYDYKVGKHAARLAWKKLSYEEQQEALSAMPRYVAATHKDGRYPARAHLATWLNQRRFEDEEVPMAEEENPAITYYDMLQSGIPVSMYEAVPQPNGRKPLWRLKKGK